MERTLRTSRSVDELSSKDLKRLTIPNDRMYLACRDNKMYRGEKIYEFAIMNKEGSHLMFATEEDFFSRTLYPVCSVELLEEEPLVSFINTDYWITLFESKKIHMANFGSFYELRLKDLLKYNLKFSQLVRLNERSVKDQKKYIDRKEKEFEEDQKRIFTQEPVVLDELQEFLP